MSKNIEDIFKESLENHEESYDPSAWKALSEKLDSVGENKTNSNTTKWKLYSLITISVAISGFLLIHNRESNNTASKSNQSKIKVNQVKHLVESATKIKTIKKESQKFKDKVSAPINKAIVVASSPLPEEVKSIEIKQENKSFNSKNENKKTLQVTSRELYCQGEKEEFKNENDFTIFLIYQSGKAYSIKSNDKIILELQEVGNYYWSYENNLNTENKMFAFEVVNTPKLNFILPQDLDLTDGLPKLSLSTNSNGINKWFLNDEFIEQSNVVELNIFNKGKHQIKLINENKGCKSELTKWFNAEENYNLLSVNGIEPTHSDSKRNSFIPYALILRNTEFRMIIISPSSGEIIFETNDIEKPWKGQNQKTNELVPQNSEYIWKVILSNPVKGEKTEYKGRITRI